MLERTCLGWSDVPTFTNLLPSFRRHFDYACLEIDGVDIGGNVFVPNHGVNRVHAGSDHVPQTHAHRVEEEDLELSKQIDEFNE